MVSLHLPLNGKEPPHAPPTSTTGNELQVAMDCFMYVTMAMVEKEMAAV